MSKLTGSKKATAVHRVGHPRDDAAERRAQGRQSVAGVSRISPRRRPSRTPPAPRSTPTTTSTRSPGAQRPLREAIAREFTRRYGVEVIADQQVTVCCGSTEAMMSTMMAIIDPGDEVVVFEPFYENYGPDAILSGATPRYVTLHPPSGSARLDVRSGRARRGVQREDEGDHPQHAEQPDREGLHARRARGDRRAVPQVGRDGDLGRDLRAHHLRRPAARSDRDDSRAWPIAR